MKTGKELMVARGYIPATCTLPADLVFSLVMSEEGEDRRACWGCNADRSICHGEPKQDARPNKPTRLKEPLYSGPHNRKRRKHW